MYIHMYICISSVQLLSPVLTLRDSMNHSMPGLPVHYQLPEFTLTHVHPVGDAIQPSHPLSSPSPPVLNLSQHHGLFKWVSSSHQVAKVIGASASTSVLPVNTQDWSPLEWIYAPINVRMYVYIYTLIHVPTNTHTHRELYKYRHNLCTCFWMYAWCIPQSPTVFSSLSSVTCIRVRTKLRWKGQPAL